MADSDTDNTDDGVPRRWLIRALVGIGFGIPVVIEGGTLVGLLKSGLFGDGDGDDAATITGPTATTSGPPPVCTGDDLLAAYARSATLSDATVHAATDGWRFALTVAVENTGDRPYELRLGTVTTQNGSRVDGTAATDRLGVGESATLSATYALPDGETPATMTIVGVDYVDGGGERLTRHTVRFGNVPVKR
ncbi:hypothetical protein KI372_04420 [Halobacterium salinarum]|nr:hypothetical protein [Halobacterium salinarum]